MNNATVSFISDAPLETISATSNDVQGLINFSENSFAIVIKLKSFNGFNSPLQQEHFNENYVESDKYPQAIYRGKIIEPVNVEEMKKIKVRTKGKLEIHGVAKEHIIPVTISINENSINVSSDFSISLADYNIEIPRIVNNKISEIIQISVNAELSPYEEVQN